MEGGRAVERKEQEAVVQAINGLDAFGQGYVIGYAAGILTRQADKEEQPGGNNDIQRAVRKRVNCAGRRSGAVLR